MDGIVSISDFFAFVAQNSKVIVQHLQAMVSIKRTGGKKANHRRMQLLNEKGVPTQTEVREQLGSVLSEVFFDSLDEKCRELMGLTPELHGSGPLLWMAPSDYLIGKLKLTPPLTDRHIRAESHKAILDLGEQCLEKFKNAIRIELLSIITETQKTMERKAKEDVIVAIQETRKEEEVKCDTKIRIILNECNQKIKKDGAIMKMNMEDEMTVTIQRERAELDELMIDMIEYATETVKQQLTAIYQEKMNYRDMDQLNEFIQFLQYVSEETIELLIKLQLHNFQNMIGLRFEMESENMTDVAAAIAEERSKCHTQTRKLRQSYHVSLAKLHSTLNKKKSDITELENESVLITKEFQAWKERLHFIIKEFQRYINYFMRAVPGQAGFLLSLENLINLEKKLVMDIDELPEKSKKKEIILSEKQIQTQEMKKLERQYQAWSAEKFSKQVVQAILNLILNDPDISGKETVEVILHELLDECEKEILSYNEEALLQFYDVKQALKCDSFNVSMDHIKENFSNFLYTRTLSKIDAISKARIDMEKDQTGMSSMGSRPTSDHLGTLGFETRDTEVTDETRFQRSRSEEERHTKEQNRLGNKTQQLQSEKDGIIKHERRSDEDLSLTEEERLARENKALDKHITTFDDNNLVLLEKERLKRDKEQLGKRRSDQSSIQDILARKREKHSTDSIIEGLLKSVSEHLHKSQDKTQSEENKYLTEEGLEDVLARKKEKHSKDTIIEDLLKSVSEHSHKSQDKTQSEENKYLTEEGLEDVEDLFKSVSEHPHKSQDKTQSEENKYLTEEGLEDVLARKKEKHSTDTIIEDLLKSVSERPHKSQDKTQSEENKYLTEEGLEDVLARKKEKHSTDTIIEDLLKSVSERPHKSQDKTQSEENKYLTEDGLAMQSEKESKGLSKYDAHKLTRPGASMPIKDGESASTTTNESESDKDGFGSTNEIFGMVIGDSYLEMVPENDKYTAKERSSKEFDYRVTKLLQILREHKSLAQLFTN